MEPIFPLFTNALNTVFGDEITLVAVGVVEITANVGVLTLSTDMTSAGAVGVTGAAVIDAASLMSSSGQVTASGVVAVSATLTLAVAGGVHVAGWGNLRADHFALEDDLVPDRFELGIRSGALTSSSEAGVTRAVDWGVMSRWGATLTWINRGGASDAAQRQAGRLEAFLASLDGFESTVALRNYVRPTPAGAVEGAISTTGTHTDKTIQCAGFVPNMPAVFVEGDMVEIAGRLYAVTATVGASAGGVATLSVRPPIRTAIPAGTAVVYDHPYMLARPLGGEVAWEYEDVRISTAVLTMIEAL